MAYRISLSQPLEKSVAEIAHELLRGAISDVDSEALSPHETVHEVRRKCKQFRGLLRLVRGPLESKGHFDRENEAIRDAAREISEVRDAEALIETYDRLMDRYADELDRRAFSTIRRKLTLRKNAFSKEIDLEDKLAAFRASMVEAKTRITDWSPLVTDFSLCKYGIKETYSRCQNRLAEAEKRPDEEVFHEWRKRAKYHRYHCELLTDIWTPVMEVRGSELGKLTESLGNEHDLSVFKDTLTSEIDRFGTGTEIETILALTEKHQEELRKQAMPLGAKVFSEKPSGLIKSWAIWYQSTVSS